ncbi:Alpha/Beta hydrolase protein [Biscogniauxia mediterranea]|nr:Alpha/Beta hydrolase protein [Biscogniauxia mediterranea]
MEGGTWEIFRDVILVIEVSMNEALTSEPHGKEQQVYLQKPMEGSLRVPFIIRLPGRVLAGTTSNEIVHVADIFLPLWPISKKCPQWFDGPLSVYNSDVTEFRIDDSMSEDCLSLCIWVPKKAVDCDLKAREEAKLRVIVWITGGAFLVSGSTGPYQNSTSWVETSQRHIVSAGAWSVDEHSLLPASRQPAGAEPDHGLGLRPAYPALPVPDAQNNYFSFVARKLGFERGGGAARPSSTIIGILEDEGYALAPYSPEGVDEEVARGISKNFFFKSVATIFRSRSAHAPTFRFLFRDPGPAGTSPFPNISPRPWMRAYHSSELPLIFGTHSWFQGPSTILEENISRAWQELSSLLRRALMDSAGWDGKNRARVSGGCDDIC